MLEVYTVMAFVDGDQGGNAAGVCLIDSPLESLQMLKIAAKVNYSETVFIEVLDGRSVAMRYFTPVEEVDLCGHATLAGFHWLVQRGILATGDFELVTRNHRLTVSIDGETIFMEQPAAILAQIPPKHFECIYSLCDGIDRSLPLYSASTGIVDLMLPFKDGGALAAFTPDFDKLAQVCSKIGVQGMHAYTPYRDNLKDHISASMPDASSPQPSSKLPGLIQPGLTQPGLIQPGLKQPGIPQASAYWVRNFAPLLGIDEESATGTSNCALSGLLAHLGNEASELCFYQGMWMTSPSIIRTRRISGGAYAVGGRCCF